MPKSKTELEAIAKRLYNGNKSLKEIDKMKDLSSEEKSTVHSAYKGMAKEQIQKKNKETWNKLDNGNKYRME